MLPPLVGLVASLLAASGGASVAPAACGAAASCSSCVAWKGCGWCGSSAFCVAGTADGPTTGRCPRLGRSSGWRHAEFLNCTVAAPSAFVHNRSNAVAFGPSATEELEPLRLRALKRSVPPELPPPPPCKEPETPPEAEAKEDSEEEEKPAEVAAPAPVVINFPTVPPTP